jgi:predicted transcriptional regulator
MIPTTPRNDKLTQYSEQLPSELTLAIKTLQSDVSRAIFFSLYKNGEMTIDNMIQELETDSNYSSILTFHLKQLQKASLVKSTYVKNNMDNGQMFYDITDFGEKVIQTMINTFKK